METPMPCRSLRFPALCGSLLVAAAVFLCQPFGVPCCLQRTSAQAGQTDSAEQARELEAGGTVAGEFGGSDTQLFKLTLSPGQYVRVVVNKEDFHLSASLLSPDRQVISENVSRRFGPLRFSFVVGAQGAAFLRLRSLERDANARRYQLRLEEVRAATARDNQEAAASSAYSEAEVLRAKWEQQSLRAAIARYSEALTIWTSVGNQREQLQTLKDIGECHFILSEYREALDAYTKSLALSQSSGDKLAELDAHNNAGYAHNYLGENPEALRHFEQVLAYRAAHSGDQDVELRRLAAQALNNAGEVYYSLSQRRKALDFFTRALAAWVETSDRCGQALAHLNLGYTYTDLGALQSASRHYDDAMVLWQAVGDLRGEAATRTAMGGLQTFLGEKQLALDYHRQALQVLQALGNHQGEAAAWNGMAQVYEDLGEPPAALDSYQRALQLNEQIGNRGFAALSQYYVGRVHQTMGDLKRAFADYSKTARLARQVGDRKVEAHALRGIGSIQEANGQREKALELYARVLTLYEGIGDRRWQARTLNRIGYVHEAMGNEAVALSYFARALALSQEVQDRREEVSTFYNMAHAERDAGHLDEALNHIAAAVGLIESLRLKIVGEQLRTSYFASVHQYYEFYIDLLMQAHSSRPNDGFAATALQVSERARARSLLETLNEQAAQSRPDSEQDSLARERSLWRQLNFKLEAQARFLNGPHTESDAAAGAEEIRVLMAEYHQVLDRIKNESPIYASLTEPQLIQAKDIQAEVGADTVLLEYAFGEQRSYLWIVTPGSIESYKLPPRAVIEKLAGEVYELLTARQPVTGEDPGEYRRRVETADANYWSRAGQLSQTLLGKVAAQISGKRLLIVGDGVLHRIPFDALPEPARDAAASAQATGNAADSAAPALPLVVGHEVVTVPSASVLSALDSESAGGVPASRLIAVLADPVFDKQDPRITKAGTPATAVSPSANEATLYQALRAAGDGNSEASLPRLSSSLDEAQAIVDLTSARERQVSTGFDANLEHVTGGGIRDFRIIHLATHGLFNDEHPELSGLILSRVDEQGRQRNGFLRADDIYNLHLNADLVVLSACRTGLGRQVTGEGVLGITRAFMYAGSRSTIASLWKVNDEATAELMKHFYSGVLKDGLPPSAALRAAKETMWKQERWRAPYFWAAFVMQGRYHETRALLAGTDDNRRLLLAAALPALAIAILLTFRSARRRKLRHAC